MVLIDTKDYFITSPITLLEGRMEEPDPEKIMTHLKGLLVSE